MVEGVRLLELARNARSLFERQDARETRRLLDVLVSNCSWKDGQLTTELHQPFEALPAATMVAAEANIVNGAESVESEIWLPFLDTYRTLCPAPDDSFRALLTGANGVGERRLTFQAQDDGRPSSLCTS